MGDHQVGWPPRIARKNGQIRTSVWLVEARHLCVFLVNQLGKLSKNCLEVTDLPTILEGERY
jgi:hypothetical protein